MQIQYCFPTAIFSTVDESLAEEMLPIAKKVLSDKELLTNILNYKSTFNPYGGVETFDEFKPFVRHVCDIGMRFFTEQGYKLDFNEFIPHVFISEMRKGDFHHIHAHPNSTLSGIFYLQVPENSGSIMFYDPKPRKNFVEMDKVFQTESNMNTMKVDPQKGLMLMWESWLEHSVTQCQNKKDGRITIVFNLSKKR
jgi:uncharacterized protein (TIGR02466 family)